MIEVECLVDDVIISQGEDGDHFYLVDSGVYEVFLKQAEDSKAVAQYEAGKSFGELALLYNSPRAATIKWKTAEILSPLTDAQRASLATSMEELSYTEGEYVV